MTCSLNSLGGVIYIYMYTCIYIYMYVCIHIHIYMGKMEKKTQTTSLGFGVWSKLLKGGYIGDYIGFRVYCQNSLDWVAV